MTGSSKQKPASVPPAKQIGLWPWLRDKMYDVVYSEGDFVLQFVADFFRGPEPAREERHLRRQMSYQAGKQTSEKPLTKSEQASFADLLRRKASEPQMIYWKRKKALLAAPNKQQIVAQFTDLQKTMAKQKKQVQTPEISIAQTYQNTRVKKKKTIRRKP